MRPSVSQNLSVEALGEIAAAQFTDAEGRKTVAALQPCHFSSDSNDISARIQGRYGEFRVQRTSFQKVIQSSRHGRDGDAEIRTSAEGLFKVPQWMIKFRDVFEQGWCQGF